jgi:Fic family protein
VRETGDWEASIHFFLEGVISVAEQAIATAQAIEALFKADQEKIMQLGKSSLSVLSAYHILQKSVIVDATSLVAQCEMTSPTALKALRLLEQANIVKETTGKERGRSYVYHRYLELLNQSIE